MRGFGALSGLTSLLLGTRRRLKIETERPRREESRLPARVRLPTRGRERASMPPSLTSPFLRLAMLVV